MLSSAACPKATTRGSASAAARFLGERQRITIARASRQCQDVLEIFPIGGVEHQHFNLDDKPSLWAAFINMPIQEHLAHDLDQTEESPEFKNE